MILEELATLLRARLVEQPEGSYSVTLLTDSELARRKIMEEAFELCLELGRVKIDPVRVREEAADLLYHVLAGLVGADVEVDDVLRELQRRRSGTS